MSVSTKVFLSRSKLPTPSAWADQIRAAGFAVDLDTDFDIEAHSGFLPARHEGKDAGFEYFFAAVADLGLEADLAAQVGSRDVSISFVTHSDMRELATAVIAAAVLSTHADGLLLDEESGELVAAPDALAHAAEVLAAMKSYLD